MVNSKQACRHNERFKSSAVLGRKKNIAEHHLCDTYHMSVYAFKDGELADSLNKLHSFCINKALKLRGYYICAIPFQNLKE